MTPWTIAHQVLLSMEILQTRILECVPKPFSGGLPNPGIELTSLKLQADSSLSEPSGKAKNTGVGSLSLLQGIIPTQKSNRGLLHCRQILCQLSYQESPLVRLVIIKKSTNDKCWRGCREKETLLLGMKVGTFFLVLLLSHVQLFATHRLCSCQVPLSMGYFRQEYWSGLLCSSPGDLPDPGIKLVSPAVQAGSFTTEPPGKPL